MDNDYQSIIFEFAMNYNIESMQIAYQKNIKENKNKVDREKLRKLGYSEEQIAKAKL